MIGSMDMFASSSSMAVSNIASTGRRSGIDCHAPRATWRVALWYCERSSWMKAHVARKARNMAPPARKKVSRMPMRPGSDPPISGPSRVPAIVPVESTPSAQPARSLGVCVAISTTAPEA